MSLRSRRAWIRAAIVTALVMGTVVAVAPGAAAFTTNGYVTRTKAISIPAESHGGGRLACPDGYRVVSGGASFPVTDPPFISHWISASVPVKAGRAWFAAGRNAESNGASTLTIRIHCLPASRLGTYTVVKATPDIDDRGAAGAYAACPPNHRIVTGGALWRIPGDPPSPSVAVQSRLSSTTPTVQATGWYADGFRGSTTARLEVLAFCLPTSKVGRYALLTVGAEEPDADQALSGRCQTGHRVVASGSYVHKPGLGPDLEEARTSSLRGTLPTGKATAFAGGIARTERTLVLLCRPTS